MVVATACLVPQTQPANAAWLHDPGVLLFQECLQTFLEPLVVFWEPDILFHKSPSSCWNSFLRLTWLLPACDLALLLAEAGES